MVARFKIEKADGLKIQALVTLSLCCSLIACGQPPSAGANPPPPVQTVVLPKSVPDPIEPFNRVMWGFNKALMTDVIGRRAGFIGSWS